MPVYTLNYSIRIPSTIGKVWDFISSPENLKRITPDYMGFEVKTKNLPEKMYAGMIISYKVSPFMGIKLMWVTEITQVQELKYFVDEQRVGPYRMWHHQHLLEQVDRGVLMTDIVDYQPPLGLLGAIANQLLIKQQLEQIFTFRAKKLEEFFGRY